MMRNRNLNTHPRSNMGWIAGAVVILLLVGGLMMLWSPDPVNTASNDTNASSPATTTGAAPARPATPAR